ncbi:MAG TPA: hypothetical protein VFD32_12025 [Dehalococcoidia bacterium]|nr:hypothetical protein [Dehalococcoidia bacterium]
MSGGTLPAVPLRAQAVGGDDLAAVMLGADDLPSFTLAGDASPPDVPDAVREQHTRVFIADGGETTLTLILSAPHPDAVCLPRIRATIANGEVLAALNADRVGYQDWGALGVGEVDWAASWSDTTGDAHIGFTVSEDVFMRGELVVYLQAVSFGTPPAAATLAGWARLQDQRLLDAAADPASAAGALARTEPPAPEDPTACS